MRNLADRLYRPLPWAAVSLLSAVSIGLPDPAGWRGWECFGFDLAVLVLTAAGWLRVIERMPDLETTRVELPPLAE